MVAGAGTAATIAARMRPVEPETIEERTIEEARKTVGRVRGGVQYRGVFNIGEQGRILNRGGMVYIRFGSHRAREYGLQAIERKPQAYWSLRRQSYPGGIYLVTAEEIAQMRAASRHVRLTVLRPPYDDLMMCWKGD